MWAVQQKTKLELVKEPATVPFDSAWVFNLKKNALEMADYYIESYCDLIIKWALTGADNE
jgi:hypothetical protein